MPAMASVPIIIVAKVTGMYFFRPPIFACPARRAIAWMTEPLPRKSSALKKACVIRWNAPAENAPTPIAANM